MDTIKRKAIFSHKFIAGVDFSWHSNHLLLPFNYGPLLKILLIPLAHPSCNAPDRCRVCKGQVYEGNDELRERVNNLERDYRNLVEEYRTVMGRQQGLIHRLAEYFEGTRGKLQGRHARISLSVLTSIEMNGQNARSSCWSRKLDRTSPMPSYSAG